MYRPGELSAADRAAWTALQSKAHVNGTPEPANPFLSPEFTLAVGRCRRGVRIAVAREGGAPAAFLPFRRTAGGVGRAVGLGVSDCQGLVHGPGFRWDAQGLLRACGLFVWEFDHLVAGRTPFEAGASGAYPSPVMDLDQGYATYLRRPRDRSPKFTRTTLGRDAGGVRYVHDERDPAALRTLMDWKSAQYRRTGRSDRFAHAKYSPGPILHLRMAEAAATDGIACLDLGRGQKEYKDSLKTRDLTVSEGWVTRRHPMAVGHRARRAPVRALRNMVLSSRPELFEPADRILKRMGKIRSRRQVTAKPTKT